MEEMANLTTAEAKKFSWWLNQIQEHSSPSPQTVQEINNMKIDMAKLKGGVDRIEQKLDFHIEQGKIDSENINKFIEGADCKYAVKDIEKDVKDLREKISDRNYEWVKYLVAVIVTIVLTLLFGKFIKF